MPGATIVNNLSAAAEAGVSQVCDLQRGQARRIGIHSVLREELIPRGIRVMALMPGATATDMWDQIMPDAPRERMIDVDSVAQTVLCAVLLPPNVNPVRDATRPDRRGAVGTLFAVRSWSLTWTPNAPLPVPHALGELN